MCTANLNTTVTLVAKKSLRHLIKLSDSIICILSTKRFLFRALGTYCADAATHEKMMYTVVEELKSLDVRINAALKYTSTSTAMSNIFDRSADIDRIPKNIAEPVRYLASVGLP